MNGLESTGARCARSVIAAAIAGVMAMGAQCDALAQAPTFSSTMTAGPTSTRESAQMAGAVLGADEAVKLAVERSQRIVANAAQIDAARDRAIAAGRRPDPVFTTGLQAVPLNGPDRLKLHNDSFTMTAFGIKQELTSRDKLAARAEVYAREAESGEAVRSLSLSEVARDTRLAWLACSYLESTAGLLNDTAREVKRHIEAVDAAYRGGRGTQSESIAIRTEFERIADRQRQNARDLAVARARLARWIGEAAAAQPLSERSSFAARFGVPLELPASQAALQRKLDAHPALKRLAAQEASARAAAEMARTERSADWSVELMVGVRRPTYSNLGTINFSIPITWNRAERQDREWAARRAEADAAAAELEEARRVVVSDVRAASEAWQHDRERLTRYGAAFIPLATERSGAALAAWRGGVGNLASVLDARHAEIETRLDRLKLERELAETAVQLDYGLAAGLYPDAREAPIETRQGER